MRTCPATPYLDAEAWRPGVLKIGEAALALDPLSSSGVERSMRLALQAAVAVNTLLCDPGSADLARDYYESSLISSSANHLLWTQGFARFSPRQMGAFWPTYFMLAYALVGLWAGRALIVIGLGVSAATALAFAYAGDWFEPWMALVNGGGLALGGLWMRRA